MNATQTKPFNIYPITLHGEEVAYGFECLVRGCECSREYAIEPTAVKGGRHHAKQFHNGTERLRSPRVVSVAL